MPVLWGGSFKARIDPLADRKAGVLTVHNTVFEKGFREHETFLPDFGHEMRRFAAFNGCDRIVFKNLSPVKIKTALTKCVNN